ncbi:MAG: poly(A) polymerase [Thermodesulfobacteriota bacterium]
MTTPSASAPQPLVIPVAEHGISRDRLDPDALSVLERLAAAGYQAYLVGGGVRDLYLGKNPKDFDISTDAHPGQIRKVFRNSRTIGRRFRLVQVFFGGKKIIEVSTFRCRSEFDQESSDKVLAANNTFGNEVDDAFRRDLTINGIFYDQAEESVIDYVGGVADLDDKVVRVIGEPERRITRDPVRMMRAVRHAARAGFTIEPATLAAVKDHLSDLSVCPVSRVRDELFKDLHHVATGPWVELAAECGLFQELLPMYRGLEPDVYQEVARLMAVSDRLQAADIRLPDDILLALLFLPWAQATYTEMGQELKTGEAFQLSRQIRDRLGKELKHLDIKRAAKEQIATLLALLPIFHQTASRGWPKWFQRKSYFKEGLLFFSLWQEAKGGDPVDPELLPRPATPPPVRRSARKPARRSRGPAYAVKKQKGGVFGFKQNEVKRKK